MPEQTPAQPSTRISKRTIWALVLLIAPTVIGIISFIMSFSVSQLIYTTGSGDIAQSVVQGVIVLLNIIAYITWLPGIIVGIILLATKSAAQQVATQASGQQPAQPVAIQELSPAQATELKGRKTKYLAWGLVLLIAPAALGIIALITLFLALATGFSNSSNNLDSTVYSIIASITGLVSFVSFVPGIVVGIILLVKRPQLQPRSPQTAPQQ